MLEVPKIGLPVSRSRRVTGLVFIALEAALAARAGWLEAFYGSAFGHDEWARFAFLLWLGTVLALTGYWLAYRSRAAAWATALAVVACSSWRRPFLLAPSGRFAYIRQWHDQGICHEQTQTCYRHAPGARTVGGEGANDDSAMGLG